MIIKLNETVELNDVAPALPPVGWYVLSVIPSAEDPMKIVDAKDTAQTGVALLKYAPDIMVHYAVDIEEQVLNPSVVNFTLKYNDFTVGWWHKGKKALTVVKEGQRLLWYPFTSLLNAMGVRKIETIDPRQYVNRLFLGYLVERTYKKPEQTVDGGFELVEKFTRRVDKVAAVFPKLHEHFYFNEATNGLYLNEDVFNATQALLETPTPSENSETVL